MAGFTTVAARAESVTGKKTVWMQSSEEARGVSERVKSLVQRKTIGPDVAVQVALLNNKGLQAAYAEIGLSAADVWQETHARQSDDLGRHDRCRSSDARSKRRWSATSLR